MRKMYSENQIKDIVNKGIEDGSIHADPSTEVKVRDINSESQTAGKVIVSDGEGGAEWGSISAGMDVVELTSSSGTLTDEQYAKVSGDNCIIKYDNNIYYKLYSQEIVSTITYYTREYYSNTSITVNNVEITTTNKSYVFRSTTQAKPNVIANPTLSGTEGALSSIQIGSTKYKVGGSEVVAYEGDTSTLPAEASYTSWTLHRAIKDGNILWIVLAGVVTCTASTTISYCMTITLPSDIASKIYREDGTTCNNSYSSGPMVMSYAGIKGTRNVAYSLESTSANLLRLDLGESFSAGNTRVDIRIPLFLDIGTIQ